MEKEGKIFRKRVSTILIIFTFLIFTSMSFVIAQQNETTNKVDKAYQWLQKEVEDKGCDSLTTEEKIFVLLAIDECESELMEDKDSTNACWPSVSGGTCNVKTTAQAILALEESNVNTDDAQKWLLSQNTTPTGIDWYLEIDTQSDEASTCAITYVNAQSISNINIGQDKKISGNPGSCLTLVKNDPYLGTDYFLKVSSSCYDETFKISCDKVFLTTLLFKESGKDTIHVSEDTSSSSADGETTEKVSFYCFKQGSSCNYEGTLWATSVLDKYSDQDMSIYLPYLITEMDEAANEKYLPESFLYILTENYRTDLLSKQKVVNNEQYYWLAQQGGNKFYDTALALSPFQYEELPEKTNTINWLLGSQHEDGYWSQGNIRDNAFLLYSIWPEKFTARKKDGADIDCVDAGFYCMSSMSCFDTGGNELTYSCEGFAYVCCDTPLVSENCVDLGGEICSSNENCVDGTTIDASGLKYGETCCFEGTCKESMVSETTECEQYFGTCKLYACDENEEEAMYGCNYGDICCAQKTKKGSYWWIWVLILLILLIVIGIIFRDKLRGLFSKFKFGFGKGRPKPGKPSGPGTPSARPMQRRIMPPFQQRQARRPVRGERGEVSEVIKKLKEMGNK